MRTLLLTVILLCGAVSAATVDQNLKNGIPASATAILPTAGLVMVANGTSFVGSTTPVFIGTGITGIPQLNANNVFTAPQTLTEQAAPAVSTVGTAKIYADSTSHKVNISRNVSGWESLIKQTPAILITPATASSATPTITCTAVAHGLVTGQTITTAGWTWTTGAINSTTGFLVTVVDANTFTFQLAGQTNPVGVIGTVTGIPQVLISTTPTLANNTAVLVERDGIAATATDGLVLANDTISDVTNKQQYSPSLRLRGHGYGSGADKTYDWRWTAIPQSASDTSILYLESSVNGVAYTLPFRFNSVGSMVTIGNITAQSGGVDASANGIAATSTDGFRLYNSTASTAGAPVQMGPRQRFNGSAWDTTCGVASPTLANHTSNGTTVTLTTSAAHYLTTGSSITLAGWTWSDGGGVVNGTWSCIAGTTGTTIKFNPTNCPTTGTNPSVVGTIGASKTHNWIVEALPATGATTTSALNISCDPGTGTYGAALVYITSGGGLTASTIVSGANVRSTSDTGVFSIGSGSDSGIRRAAPDTTGIIGRSGGASISSAASALSLGASGTVSGNAVAPVATTTHTRTNNVATMTTGVAHNLVAGQRVTISGCTTGTYNLVDVKVVAVGTVAPATQTFTYVCVGADDAGTADATGTVTALAEVQLGSNVRVPSPVQAAGGTAGTDLYVYGSNAMNGTTPNTVTNNAGGNLILTGGVPTGTGARGTVQCPGAGAGSTGVGPSVTASGLNSIAIGNSTQSITTGSIAIGSSAISNFGASIAVGTSSLASGSGSIALGYGCRPGGTGSIMLGYNPNSTPGPDAPYAFGMKATPIVDSTTTSSAQSDGSSAEAILVTDQVDVTQAAITNTNGGGATRWTVTVAGTSPYTVTVDTNAAMPHKFSINQQVTTNALANWTNNTFMAGITFTILTTPSANTFTFSSAAPAGTQAATGETNTAAVMTPGDILLTLSTNTTFYPTEVWVWTSAGVINANPFVRFGITAGGAEYVDAVQATGLGAAKTRCRYTTLKTALGGATLSAGITTAGTATSGTPKIRFGFKGIYVRD